MEENIYAQAFGKYFNLIPDTTVKTDTHAICGVGENETTLSKCGTCYTCVTAGAENHAFFY